MNDLQIKCFIEAAKYENFTKAAEVLYISQPVVGRHIANLEKELGFQLFYRIRKTVKLTENGVLFAEFINETEKRFKAVSAKMLSNIHRQSKTLNIGAAEGTRLSIIFSSVIKSMLSTSPNLKYSFSYYESIEHVFSDLNNNIIDIGLVDLDMVMDRKDIYYSKIISTVKSCIIIPDVLPLAHKSDITSDDFKACNFIVRSEDDCKLIHDAQLEDARKLGISNIIEASNLTSFNDYLLAGLGISSVMSNHELCFNLNFRSVVVPKIIREFTECLAWLKDNQNPSITAFCHCIDEAGICHAESERVEIG